MVMGDVVLTRGRGSSIPDIFPTPDSLCPHTEQALHLPGPLIFKEIKVRSGC